MTIGQPICGKCGGVMTPEKSRQRPELFLHDDCLPDELSEDRSARVTAESDILDDLKGTVYQYARFGASTHDRNTSRILERAAAEIERLRVAAEQRDDLLVACEAVLAYDLAVRRHASGDMRIYGHWIDLVRATVAKATGREMEGDTT